MDIDLRAVEFQAHDFRGAASAIIRIQSVHDLHVAHQLRSVSGKWGSRAVFDLDAGVAGAGPAARSICLDTRTSRCGRIGSRRGRGLEDRRRRTKRVMIQRGRWHGGRELSRGMVECRRTAGQSRFARKASRQLSTRRPGAPGLPLIMEMAWSYWVTPRRRNALMGHVPMTIELSRADKHCLGIDNGMTNRATTFGYKEGARPERIGHAAILREVKRPRILATRERIGRVQSEGGGSDQG